MLQQNKTSPCFYQRLNWVCCSFCDDWRIKLFDIASTAETNILSSLLTDLFFDHQFHCLVAAMWKDTDEWTSQKHKDVQVVWIWNWTSKSFGIFTWLMSYCCPLSRKLCNRSSPDSRTACKISFRMWEYKACSQKALLFYSQQQTRKRSQLSICGKLLLSASTSFILHSRLPDILGPGVATVTGGGGYTMYLVRGLPR